MSAAEATLSGTVTNHSGTPLSGASVAIFNNSTNKEWRATTDGSGAYSIQSIAAGSYDIEVEGDGASATADDVSLPAGNIVMNFTLSKGSGIPGGDSDTLSYTVSMDIGEE